MIGQPGGYAVSCQFLPELARQATALVMRNGIIAGEGYVPEVPVAVDAFEVMTVGFVLYLLAAVVLRRWLLLLIPAVLIPLAYYGEDAGWWGGGAPLRVQWWAWPAVLTVPVVAFTTALIGIAKLASRFENGTKVVNIAASGIALGAIVIIVLAHDG